MDEDDAKVVKSNAMANQFLALALFIMLLAFFIVLNAISEFEEQKVAPIMKSIEQAFTGGSDILPTRLISSQGEQPSDNETDAQKQSTEEGNALDEIEGLFQAQIPGLKVEKDTKNGQFIVNVKLPVLEYAIDHLNSTVANPYIVKKEGFDYFFGGIVYLMKNNESFNQYHVDIFINTARDPSSKRLRSTQNIKNKIALSSQMAEKLEKTGLNTRFVNIGLEKGRRGFARVIFREYKDYSPVGQGVTNER